MRGQAIAGLARTPRGSLIVLKLEKTCQTICHIYISIQELYSIYTGCHTHTTNLFCFVMSFSWLNAFKCSARSLPLSHYFSLSRIPEMETGKAKTENRTEPKPHSTQATQICAIHQRSRSRCCSRSRRRCRKLHAHAHTQINNTSGSKSQESRKQ